MTNRLAQDPLTLPLLVLVATSDACSYSERSEESLNSRHIRCSGTFTAPSYAEALGVSRKTAYHYLDRLMDDGTVVKVRRGRYLFVCACHSPGTVALTRTFH